MQEQNQKVGSYKTYIEYRLSNVEEPKFFTLQVIAKQMGPLGALVFLSALVFYFDSTNIFAWRYFSVVMVIFACLLIIQLIFFKRGRLYSSWKRNVDKSGVIRFNNDTVAKAVDVMRTKNRFRDVQEAEEEHGSDVIDLLFLTDSYQTLPNNGGYIRVVKYDE